MSTYIKFLQQNDTILYLCQFSCNVKIQIHQNGVGKENYENITIKHQEYEVHGHFEFL